MSKGKSILLQVAFKEAVPATLGTNKSVKDTTVEFFNILTELHDQFGISPDTSGGGGGGGGRKAPDLPSTVTQFTDSEGQTWYDFREALAKGQVVKEGHPEFKSTDFKQSEWIYDKQGNEKENAIPLREAADNMKSLAAPM